MSIKIYTYSNPYELEKEVYWDIIRNSPHFCASQTLVNGFKDIYSLFKTKNNITTIQNLINYIYNKWDDPETRVKQMIEVDNAISKLVISGNHVNGVRKALLNNTKSLTNSLRILFELNLDPANFDTTNINLDQKYLVDIFKIIINNPKSSFKFDSKKDKTTLLNCIKQCLIDNAKNNYKNKNINFDELNLSRIVFVGIHQFTPAMLCAIEELSHFFDVYLIFNYQKQYEKIYKTWIDIYTLFNEPIKFSDNTEFVPNIFTKSYDGNLLADSMGKIVECNYQDENAELSNIEIMEFENLTEFANYVADKYEQAKIKKCNNSDEQKSVLKYMNEQFYSPSLKVNDILRAYFPEQYEDRHFLDYPLGHFFISAMKIWNPDNNDVEIMDFADIKECLNSGIITESKSGLLITTFNKIISFIDDQTSLIQIVKKLKKLKQLLGISNSNKNKIGYFNVKTEDLSELIGGLDDLNNIIAMLFKNFSVDNNNFKTFYEKIKKFISSRIDNEFDIGDKEMVDVLKQLLSKMENTDFPNNGSFITLKQTISFYLSQDKTLRKGDIVRGFERVDGDVLLSNNPNNNADYHFCCLSDKDICASKDERMPWPLEVSFFDYIQIPLDWKYQVYLKSRTEFHNFNRYVLLYGLEFLRNGFKLSYIKKENDKENDIYHLLSMLNLRIVKYNAYDKSGISIRTTYPMKPNIDVDTFVSKLENVDKRKVSICHYKFGAEVIIQNHSIYRDRFLIHCYMRILIKNNVLKNLQNEPRDEGKLRHEIEITFDKYDSEFQICSNLEKAQIISQVYKDIISYKWNFVGNKFRVLKPQNNIEMSNNEEILPFNTLNDLNILEKDEIENILIKSDFSYTKSNYCKFCASKDVCLESKD